MSRTDLDGRLPIVYNGKSVEEWYNLYWAASAETAKLKRHLRASQNMKCKKCSTELQEVVDDKEGNYHYCSTCRNCQMPGTAPQVNDLQHGGTHYKCMAIQPWDYILANGIGYLEGSAIKYLTRWREKGGVEDLKKASHFIAKLIESEAVAIDISANTEDLEKAFEAIKGYTRTGPTNIDPFVKDGFGCLPLPASSEFKPVPVQVIDDPRPMQMMPDGTIQPAIHADCDEMRALRVEVDILKKSEARLRQKYNDANLFVKKLAGNIDAGKAAYSSCKTKLEIALAELKRSEECVAILRRTVDDLREAHKREAKDWIKTHNEDVGKLQSRLNHSEKFCKVEFFVDDKITNQMDDIVRSFDKAEIDSLRKQIEEHNLKAIARSNEIDRLVRELQESEDVNKKLRELMQNTDRVDKANCQFKLDIAVADLRVARRNVEIMAGKLTDVWKIVTRQGDSK